MDEADVSISLPVQLRQKPGLPVPPRAEVRNSESLGDDEDIMLFEDPAVDKLDPGKVPVTIRQPFSHINSNGEFDYDDEDGMMIASSRQNRMLRNNNKIAPLGNPEDFEVFNFAVAKPNDEGAGTHALKAASELAGYAAKAAGKAGKKSMKMMKKLAKSLAKEGKNEEAEQLRKEVERLRAENAALSKRLKAVALHGSSNDNDDVDDDEDNDSEDGSSDSSDEEGEEEDESTEEEEEEEQQSEEDDAKKKNISATAAGGGGGFFSRAAGAAPPPPPAAANQRSVGGGAGAEGIYTQYQRQQQSVPPPPAAGSGSSSGQHYSSGSLYAPMNGGGGVPPPLPPPTAASAVGAAVGGGGGLMPAQVQKGPLLPRKATGSAAGVGEVYEDRDAVKLPPLLWEGGYLWKIPYNGKGAPERRIVAVKRSQGGASIYARPVILTASSTEGVRIDGSRNQVVGYVTYPLTLIWYHTGGAGEILNARELMLMEGAHVVAGHSTPAFWKLANRQGPLPRPELCFSVVTSTRTLDLAAETAKQGDDWKKALISLLVAMGSRNQKTLDEASLLRDKPSWNNSAYGNAAAAAAPTPPNITNKSAGNNYNIGGVPGGFAPPPPPSSSSGSLPPPPPSSHCSQTTTATAAGIIMPPPSPYDTTTTGTARPGTASARRLSSDLGADQQPLTAKQRLARREALKEQLFTAVRKGDIRAVEEALEAGVPVNLMEPTNKDTPLMIACRLGHSEIVKLCLLYGAKNDPHPDFGQTALHSAVGAGKYDSCVALLSAAEQSQADAIVCNLTDPQGKTPLHLATALGHTALVDLLLSHGADICRVDDMRQTALHLASVGGHVDTMSTLLDNEGDVLVDEKDALGNTPLHLAAHYGMLSCVRLLLETAASATTRNARNQTPYNLAVSRGHSQVSMLLLEYHNPLEQQQQQQQQQQYDGSGSSVRNLSSAFGLDPSIPFARSQSDGTTPMRPTSMSQQHPSISTWDSPTQMMSPGAGVIGVGVGVGVGVGAQFMGTPSHISRSVSDPSVSLQLPRPHSINSTPQSSQKMRNLAFQSLTPSQSQNAMSSLNSYQPAGVAGAAAASNNNVPFYGVQEEPFVARMTTTVAGSSSSSSPFVYRNQTTGDFLMAYPAAVAGGGGGNQRVAMSARFAEEAVNSSNGIRAGDVYLPNTARERPTPQLFQNMQVNYGYPQQQEQEQQQYQQQYQQQPPPPPHPQQQYHPPHPQQQQQYQEHYHQEQYQQQALPGQHYQQQQQQQDNFDRYTYNTSQAPSYSGYGYPNTTTSIQGPDDIYGYDQQGYATQLLQQQTTHNNTGGTTTAEECPPLETFDYLGLRWNSYNTDEGYQYFLTDIISETTGQTEAHSQWDDPRTHGFISDLTGGGSSAADAGGGDDSYAADISTDPGDPTSSTTPRKKATPNKKLTIDTRASPSNKMLSPPKSPGQRFPQGGPNTSAASAAAAAPLARRIFIRDDDKDSSSDKEDGDEEHEGERSDMLSPLEVSSSSRGGSGGLSTRVMNPVTASYYSYATTDDDYSDREVVLRKVASKKDKQKKGKSKGKGAEFHPAGAVLAAAASKATHDDNNNHLDVDEQYKATERNRRVAAASTPVRSRGGTITRAGAVPESSGAVPESLGDTSRISPVAANKHHHLRSRPNVQEQLLLNLDGSDINESDYTEGESGKGGGGDDGREIRDGGEKSRRPRVSRASVVSASETSDWDASIEVVKRKPRGLTRAAFVSSGGRRPKEAAASPGIDRLMEMAGSDGRFNIVPGELGDALLAAEDGYHSPEFYSPRSPRAKEASDDDHAPAPAPAPPLPPPHVAFGDDDKNDYHNGGVKSISKKFSFDDRDLGNKSADIAVGDDAKKFTVPPVVRRSMKEGGVRGWNQEESSEKDSASMLTAENSSSGAVLSQKFADHFLERPKTAEGKDAGGRGGGAGVHSPDATSKDVDDYF